MVHSTHSENKLHFSFPTFLLFFGTVAGLIHLVQTDVLLKLAGVVFLTLAFLAWWPKLQRDDLSGIAAQGLAVFAAAVGFLYFFIEGVRGIENVVGMGAVVCEAMICLTYLSSKFTAVRKKKAAVVYSAIPRHAPVPVHKRSH